MFVSSFISVPLSGDNVHLGKGFGGAIIIFFGLYS
jgi:hypothetical protein